MPHTTENVIEILKAAKCSITVDSTFYSVTNLLKIVEAAAKSGSQVTIKNGDMYDVKQLIEIAKAGGGNVTIDVC